MGWGRSAELGEIVLAAPRIGKMRTRNGKWHTQMCETDDVSPDQAPGLASWSGNAPRCPPLARTLPPWCWVYKRVGCCPQRHFDRHIGWDEALNVVLGEMRLSTTHPMVLGGMRPSTTHPFYYRRRGVRVVKCVQKCRRVSGIVYRGALGTGGTWTALLPRPARRRRRSHGRRAIESPSPRLR